MAIGSIPLIMTLGNSMLIPILPAMKEQLELSQMQVSLTITVYSIASALFIPILGYLSDRYTRKIIIIPSLVLFMIGGLISGFAAALFSNAYTWILIGRILQGIGAAGTASIAMALTGDLFKGQAQSHVLGIFEASNGLGKVLSPILGALFGLIVWYAVFFAFPIMTVISLLLVIFFVKEEGLRYPPPSFKKYVRGLLSVFQLEGRWLFVTYLAGGTCLFTLFGILFYLSDILETRYHIEGVIKGLILAIPLLFMVSTAYMTGRKIGKNFPYMKRLMLVGFTLMTCSYLLLAFFENLIIFIILLALSGFGVGLSLPCINSLITGSVEKENRGFVTSLYSSVRFIGVAIGPPIFARLMDWSHIGMFISLTILTFIVTLLILFLIRISDSEPTQHEPIRYTYY
ncbi:MAG TPA: MFS transporter [Cerasibacillus sp.]